jgi:2-isopropylmalate synthase
MAGSDRVIIFDTTLRDGEQSPGVALQLEEKLEIARQLARLGVDVIEAGFPVNSQGEMRAVQAIAAEVRGPVIAALARTHPRDIDAAWEAVSKAESPRIHTFTSASPVHLRHMLRMTEDEVVEMAVAAVRQARRYVSDVEFSAQDVARAERGFLVRLYGAAIAAGATTINIPDTVGYATPREFADIVRFMIENVPGADRVVVSVHTHDDLGMAVANALAAVEVGARQVECAVNGIGERAGNCSLEEVVMALVTRRDWYGKTVGVRTQEIYRTSRLVATLTGMPVPPNKAVVGANAFAHESGIHQDGVLKERTTYEIMRPEDVGVPTSRIVLGKHSGRHAFRARLEELGYRLGEDDFRKAFTRFKELVERKKEVSDRDIEAVIRDEVVATPPEIYRLEYFHVTAGTQTVPTATVRVAHQDGSVVQESASGDGPVDAVYRAVDRAVGGSHRLLDYALKAVTGGQDAVGEVTVRVAADDGRVAAGRGASTDVIEASARAYLAAINRLMAAGRPAAPDAEAAGAAKRGA